LSPAVVHAWSAGAIDVARSICDEFDIDLLLQVSGSQEIERLALGPIRSIVRYIAGSQPLADALDAQARLPPGLIEVVRPGLPASDEPCCFADSARIPGLVCLADFDHGEISTLVEALRLLRLRGHEFLAFLLGRGRNEPAVRKLVRDRELSSLITFASPGGRVNRVLQQADILIHPALVRAIAAEALQAMACGLCVVAFRSPMSDFMIDGRTMIAMDAPAAGSMCDVLDVVLTNREHARRIAEGGLQRVREFHSVSGMADRLAAIYRRIAFSRSTIPMNR
jgi:hypothetical protein